jgi:predicted DNA-binding transcriptional regulator AlpA
MKQSSPSATYLTAPQVRTRYAIAQTTFWRWEHDVSIAFPKPLRIGRKKLYSLAEIEQWERARAAA